MKSCENCAYYDMGRDEQPCFGCVEGINYEEKETEGMSNFEKMKSMSIDDLAKWLDEYGQFDNSPWSNWFAKKYCNNCESIKCRYDEVKERLDITPFYNREIECAYCELEKKCQFFSEIEDIPNNVEVVKMWLESEVEDEEII